MNLTPASVIPHPASGPGRLIGLYLARLFACLVRLDTSRERYAPSDITQMVASAEAMVYGFIRLLAAAQLESAGYTSAAHAMRTQAALWRDTTVQIDSGQATPADLIARLETIIANFERAYVLAHLLVCVIVCTRGNAAAEMRSAFARVRTTAHPVRISRRHTRPAPDPWPPPRVDTVSARRSAQAAGGADTQSQTNVGSTRIRSGLDPTYP